MAELDKARVFSQDMGTGKNYVLFFDWEGRRFSRVWGIADGSELDPVEVAEAMIRDSQNELDSFTEDYQNGGGDANDPYPDFVNSEDWTELDITSN